MYRVTNGYKSLKLADFAQVLNTITGKMTDNDNFPAEQANVKKLAGLEAEYLPLAEKAVKGSTESRLARNAKRTEIIALLHTIGYQVTAVCNNDLEMLVSSGFPHTNPSSSTGKVGKPPAPKVSTGLAARQLICTGVKPKGTVIEFMIAPMPVVDGGWKTFGCRTRSYTFTDLTPGVEYMMKYAILGAKDQRVESDAVSLRPQ